VGRAHPRVVGTRLRWLVTGGCGRLGSHVLEELHRRGEECLGVSRHQCGGDHGPTVACDLDEKGAVGSLLDAYRPTHIIHLAGISSPSAAERCPARAWRLNVDVTRRLAGHARGTGAHLLLASSDFVWSGDGSEPHGEDDPPDGDGVYAKTKIAAEQEVLRRGVGTVARYSGMYGLPRCRRATLFETQLEQLRAHEPLPVVFDEYRTPLSLADAARATVRLSDERFTGIVHVAGPEILTPAEQVRRYARVLHIADPPLQLVARATLDPLVRRPRNMAMAATVLARSFTDVLPKPISAEQLLQDARAGEPTESPALV
jgi:dTDP-4-dehydrorhamnose reductase